MSCELKNQAKRIFHRHGFQKSCQYSRTHVQYNELNCKIKQEFIISRLSNYKVKISYESESRKITHLTEENAHTLTFDTENPKYFYQFKSVCIFFKCVSKDFPEQ